MAVHVERDGNGRPVPKMSDDRGRRRCELRTNPRAGRSARALARLQGAHPICGKGWEAYNNNLPWLGGVAMPKSLSLLLAAILLSSAAYGQSPPSIYLVSQQCMTGDALTLLLPSSQVIPVEIWVDPAGGAQTFEFSIPGFVAQPGGALVTDVVANPAAVSAEGDPFAAGARISFSTCQSSPVMLYTANIMGIGVDSSIPWRVNAHSSPSVPGTTCATATP